MTRKRLILLLLLAACAGPGIDRAQLIVPEPDTSQLEPSLKDWLLGVRADVAAKVADPKTKTADLETALGDYGQVLHAFDLRQAAIEAYAQAAKLDPNDFRWPYLAARLKEFQGDLDGAREDLERALRLDSGAAHAWVRLGDVRRAQGDAGSAASSYRRALDLEETAAAWFGLGQAQLASDDFETAVESFRRALVLQPSASAIHVPLAQALRARGRDGEADQALARRGRQSVILDDPTTRALGDVRILGTYKALFSMAAADDLTAEELLGFTLTQLGDVDGSEETLAGDLSAIESDDAQGSRRQRARLHYVLGGLRVYLGDDESAIGNFLRALELEPEMPPAQLKLGNVLARRGSFDTAVERYTEVLEADPDNFEALLKRGTAFLNLRQPTSAAADLQRVLSLDPSEPLARVRLAEAREVAGDLSGAESGLRRAVTSQDLDARGRAMVWRGLGDFLIRRQRLDEAAAAFGEALEEDRTLNSARLRRADVLATLGRFDEALSEYDLVVVEQPSNAIAHLHRTGVLLLTREWRQAIDSLSIALDLNPGNLAIEHQLARALAANPEVRDPERALQLATRVHEQQPTAASAVTLGMALAGASRFEDALAIEAHVPEGPLKGRRVAAYREARSYSTSDARELLVTSG